MLVCFMKHSPGNLNRLQTSGRCAADVHWDDRNNPRIQMADLLAREGMKDLLRTLEGSSVQLRHRRMMLEASERFAFVDYNRSALEKWALQVDEMARAEGDPGSGYLDWLLATRRVQHGKPQDNMGNRLAYFRHLDKSPKRQ